MSSFCEYWQLISEDFSILLFADKANLKIFELHVVVVRQCFVDTVEIGNVLYRSQTLIVNNRTDPQNDLNLVVCTNQDGETDPSNISDSWKECYNTGTNIEQNHCMYKYWGPYLHVWVQISYIL